MIITTQPTAVSLVKLTRQLNGEISFFLTYDDNPNPNPTQDKGAVRTLEPDETSYEEYDQSDVTQHGR